MFYRPYHAAVLYSTMELNSISHCVEIAYSHTVSNFSSMVSYPSAVHIATTMIYLVQIRWNGVME